jgi:hypothetical protein
MEGKLGARSPGDDMLLSQRTDGPRAKLRRDAHRQVPAKQIALLTAHQMSAACDRHTCHKHAVRSAPSTSR